ncbi:MAG: dienelactone hydrolase family protein, partial [Acidimicrobiales bacterium]
RWLTDLVDARRELATRADLDPQRIGVTGFCFGGFVALLAATDPSDRWAAAVPFYGPPAGYGNLGAPSEPRPLDRLDTLSCPTLMLYGSSDPYIPVEDVAAFADRAHARGADVEVRFEAAGHAFFNDTRDSHDPAAARSAWDALLAFTRRVLGE